MIDKESQIPLHYQIYTDILEKIKNKEYKVNDKLPSEKELQDMYGVSRITVRRAMEDLQREGYAAKYRGIGTVVCKPKKNFNLRMLSSFSEDNEKYGEKASSILVKFQELIADQRISDLLNLNSSEKIFYIERIRLSGDTVIGLHKAYIKKLNNLTLKEDDFKEDTSLYKLLKDKGIKIDHAEEKLEAKISNEELNKILKVDNIIPIFYKERLTYDSNNRPVEYVEMYYNADMYEYSVLLDLNKDK
ncbi:GntR family transcriptional regulator [Clostridium nigeriense]|uniref:GntR family transcriptional regulator n=1 Tax=Clostridium nigeriense TaxID=1805470 RepID=UPI00082DA17F|nr:GntR family transcriptional regulator [Clostridium nigeriense]